MAKRLMIISLLLTALVIGGLLFYWFQWRPTELRKQCHLETEAFGKTQAGFAEALIPDETKKERDEFFENCLRSKGVVLGESERTNFEKVETTNDKDSVTNNKDNEEFQETNSRLEGIQNQLDEAEKRRKDQDMMEAICLQQGQWYNRSANACQ